MSTPIKFLGYCRLLSSSSCNQFLHVTPINDLYLCSFHDVCGVNLNIYFSRSDKMVSFYWPLGGEFPEYAIRATSYFLNGKGNLVVKEPGSEGTSNVIQREYSDVV
jgi:hypothetical protein